MADNIQATPRNYVGGLLTDAYKWMQSPERTQQMQGFAGLLGTTGLPQTIERLSYADDGVKGFVDALTNVNKANVPLLKPETADALMTVAPFAGPAARGSSQLARGVGRLAGGAVNDAMVYGRGPLASITPQPMRAVENIYHGTTSQAAKAIEKSGFDLTKSADGTAWFTSNPNIGEVAASGKGGIVQRSVDTSKMKLGGWDEADKYSTDELINMGFDGLKLTDNGESTYQIFNTDKLSKPLQKVVDETPVGGLLTTPRESFVSGVPAGQEMIVHHNISPQKLARVEQVGGMPVPSIAVSNVDNPMLNFGDISLIGPKEMAIPSAKNPVFGFDAYTARAPKIDYQMDAKSSKKLQGLFADVADDVGGDYELTRLAQNWEDRQYSKPMMAKFLKEKGALPDRKDFDDGWKYNQALSDGVYNLKAEYGDWLNDFNKRLPDAGVDIKERIFKGYTNSGNRRYAPATLDNLVKEMKGGAGSEGFMYGVGNIRAVATPKFKNLNQVKASRENIVTPEKFEPIKKQIDSAFGDLTERLGKLEGLSGYRYDAPDALYEIGQTRNVNLLDKIYKDVPQELKADVQVFMNKLREMPTEYFEIKPQRAVQVGEFKGAILPANVPQQSVDYLRNQGLQDLYYYSTPEERKELFKKFGPEMFAAMPALPLGAGMLDQEEDKLGLNGLLGR